MLNKLQHIKNYAIQLGVVTGKFNLIILIYLKLKTIYTSLIILQHIIIASLVSN